MKNFFYSKLFLFFLSVLLVLVNVVWFLPVKNSLKDNINRLELEMVEKSKISTEFFLKDNIADLKITAHHLHYPLNRQENLYTLQKILKNKNFNEIVLFDKEGNEIYKLDRFIPTPLLKLENKSNYSEFKEVINLNKTFFGKVEFSENLEPSIKISVPVLSIEGNIDGVISGKLNIKSVFDYISFIKVGERGKTYITDKEGILIAHPDTSLVLKKTDYSSREIVAAALSEKGTIVSDDNNYEYVNEEEIEVLAAASYIPETDWVVVVEEPIDEAFKTLTKIKIFAFIVVFLGIILVFFLRIINLKLFKMRQDLQLSLENEKKLLKTAEKAKYDLEISNTELEKQKSQLQNKFDEIDKMNKLMLNREMKMIELKREIEKLKGSQVIN